MKKLIEALEIFLKYGNPERPTCCGESCLYVSISPSVVSEEDKVKLDELNTPLIIPTKYLQKLEVK